MNIEKEVGTATDGGTIPVSIEVQLERNAAGNDSVNENGQMSNKVSIPS